MTVAPVVVGVVASRLESILDEQQTALINTAFSTVVRESLDLACGVFDTRGLMIGQSQSGTPGHINAMATGVKHLVAAFPPDRLDPGDVLVTNDPWLTSGQVNDLTVLTPIFHRGRVVASFASCCHAPDIGGRLLSGDAREVFEEGLQLPPLKFIRAGELNADLVAIVRENVRTPDETVGDMLAQAAGNVVGGRALVRMLDEFGLDSIDPIAEEIMRRSERAMRDAIAALPDGTYAKESWSDGYDESIVLRVTATIAGDEITLDFAGSSAQSAHGINVVLNYTHAYASFAMKASVAPGVPHNEGSFRPVHVTAPPGSVLNALRPAAVAGRHVMGHMLPSLILGALAPAMPGRVLAGSSDTGWLTVWRGPVAGSDEPFNLTLFHQGGMGARAVKDGLNATGFPSGVAAVPTEIVEALAPLVYRQRALRTDSGGAGRQRGGLGHTSAVECRSDGPFSASLLVDRTRHPAQGLLGGEPGGAGKVSDEAGAPIPLKRNVTLASGTCVQLELPGGGGYGDPVERDPAAVLADVVDGYVSIEAAAERYGVVVRYVGRDDALVRLPEDYVLGEIGERRARR